jgi:hypothetical protein
MELVSVLISIGVVKVGSGFKTRVSLAAPSYALRSNWR